MIGLFIGRFQPLHKGHLQVLQRMDKECDKILVGVGSAQKEREARNPLSGGERIEMIRSVLENRDLGPFEIHPIPDIDCHPAWPYYVKSILPPFHRIYAHSPTVLGLSQGKKVETVDLEEIKPEMYSGSEIRRRIREGVGWEDLVPFEVYDFLEDIDMEERLKPVIGIDSETEKTAAHLLTKKGKTIATAESCTGGLISNRLTDVPGSSLYFMQGVVTYSNEAKMELLGVKQDTLDETGAVSEEVARQMAQGVRKAAGTDLGLSTTGIAGPGGGTEEKPIGTVYLGLSTEDGTITKHFKFSGNRWEVKKQTSEKALEAIIEELGEDDKTR